MVFTRVKLLHNNLLKKTQTQEHFQSVSFIHFRHVHLSLCQEFQKAETTS